MKRIALLLAALGLSLALAACGSSRHTAAGCRVSRTCPSNNGSYAWRPLAGGPELVCGTPGLVNQSVYSQFLDYSRHIYLCKMPFPANPAPTGGVSFNGPTTVAAGAVPLKPDQFRFTIYVYTHGSAVLTVDWGDGTRLQRTVHGSPTLNLVHSYARTRSSYFLVTLKDKGGYLGVAGEGPFTGPAPGPRTRYCSYVAQGKGGKLSATPNLTCAEALRLFKSMSPAGKVTGYTCTETALPPSSSDAGVTTCTSGSRAFVFTTNS